MRELAFALAVVFAASFTVQVFAVSEALAQKKPCTNTSSDKKKGYKC